MSMTCVRKTDSLLIASACKSRREMPKTLLHSWSSAEIQAWEDKLLRGSLPVINYFLINSYLKPPGESDCGWI